MKAIILLCVAFAFSTSLMAQRPGEWITGGPTGLNPQINMLTADPTNPSLIYAGTGNKGIYSTQDAGLSWQHANPPMNDKQVNAILVEHTVYAGTNGFGVFRSVDAGLNWTAANAPMDDKNVTTLISVGNTLYAGTSGDGIFRSSDSGVNWSPANPPINDKTVTALIVVNNTLYAGTAGSGIYRSVDGGINWIAANAPLDDKEITALISEGANLYAGTPESGVFRSTDGGVNWIQANAPMNDKWVTALLSVNGTLLAGTLLSGIFRSTDNGLNWSIDEFQSFSSATTMTSNGNMIIAGTTHQTPSGLLFGIFYSSDDGVTWNGANFPGLNGAVNTIIWSNDFFYAGTGTDGVYRSTNDGRSWFRSGDLTNANLERLIADLNFIVGYGDGDVFLSSNGGTSWQPAPSPIAGLNVRNVISADGTLYAGTGLDLLNFTAGAYRSIDGGETWTKIDSFGTGPALKRPWVENFHVIDGQIFALLVGTLLGDIFPIPNIRGLFVSSNGQDWHRTNAPEMNVTSMISEFGKLFAATGKGVGFLPPDPQGIFFSINGGNDWNPVNTAIDSAITTMISYQGSLYAGTSGQGIFKSTDGLNWTEIEDPIDAKQITALTSDDMIYAGTATEGVFRSSDGEIWFPANGPMNNKAISSLVSIESILYAGTPKEGIYRSIDNGINWTPLITGLGSRSVRELAYFPLLNRLYAATDNGVYFQELDNNAPVANVIDVNLENNFAEQRDVSLFFSVEDPDSMLIAEDGNFSNANWQVFEEITTFSVSDGDGPKSIFAKFKDISANESKVISTNFILDTTPPQFAPHTAPDTAILGNSVEINQQVIETNLQNMRLFFRRVGESWNDDFRVTFQNTIAIIDSVFVNNRGLDYRIVALDSAGNETTLQNDSLDYFSLATRLQEANLGSSPGLPSGTGGGAYRLISVPMKLTGSPTARLALGDLGKYGDEGDWRFWKYQGNEQWIEGENNQLLNGEAYFIILRNGGSLTNHIPGTTMPTTSGLRKEIPGWHLKGNEWNIVGNPYKTRIDLEQLKLSTQGVSLSAHDSLEHLQIWSYDGSATQSGWTNEEIALEPWSGLAIWVKEADTIVFANNDDPYVSPVLAKQHSGLLTSATKDLRLDEWILKIQAASKGYIDEFNYLGIREDARDDYDRYDWQEPPIAPGGFSVSFHNAESPTSPNLAADIRSMNPEGHTWSMRLAGRGGEVIKVRFENADEIPDDVEVFVVEDNFNIVKEIRDISEFEFLIPKQAGLKTIQIIAGLPEYIKRNIKNSDAIPENFRLHQNFPNPFNPSTVILYEIPIEGRVTLSVFDILGREVLTLLKNKITAPGYYKAVLDMRNYAAGVYFYQLTVAGEMSFQQAKKLILVK